MTGRLSPAIGCLLVGALAGAGAAGAAGRADEPPLEQLTSDGFFKQRPRWSPDGGTVVFARHQAANISLFLLTLGTGAEDRLTDSKSPEYDAVFSPDGHSLLYSFDKTTPNQGDLDVYRVRLDDRQPRPVAVTGTKLSHEESADFAPDGKRLVFTSTRDGNQELYVADLAGGDWTRLTSDPAIDAHPVWSPDGKTIAFSTSRWGDLEIALIRPDGTGLQRITRSRGLDDYPAFSPDGRHLAFASNRDRNMDIHVHTLARRKSRPITQTPAFDSFPAWTPDGQLGFVSNRDGGFDLYVTKGWSP